MLIDVTATRNENNTATMVVSIPRKDWDKEVKNTLKLLASRADIKGFRKGNVPASVIRKIYGDQAIRELVAETISRQHLGDMIEDAKLNAVDRSTIEDVVVNDDKVLITYTVPVMPEIELGEWKNLGIEKEEVSVSDEDVEKEIKNKINADAEQELVEDEGAKEGDTVITTVTLSVDGQDEPVTINGKSFELTEGENEAIAAALTGKKAGETAEAELEDAGILDASLIGEKAKVALEIENIYRPVLPELNEEYLAKLTGDDSIKTEDDLRAFVREHIEKREEKRTDTEYRAALMAKLRENHPVDIPEGAIQSAAFEQLNELAQMYGAKDFRDFASKIGDDMANRFVASAMEQAGPLVHDEIILSAVAKANGIDFTDEQLEEEAKNYAKENGMEEADFLENLDRENFRNFLIMNKAYDAIVDAQ